MAKRRIVLKDRNGEVVGTYDRLESMDDIYIYMGKIVNSRDYAVTFTYLQHKDPDDDFEEYLNKVRNDKNIIFEFLFWREKYVAYLEELQS